MTDDTSGNGAGIDGEPSIRYELDDDERHSDAVVRAVASFTDTAVLDLDPLYHVIDPAHLDGITGDLDDGAHRECSLEFRFNGCLVTVTRTTVRVSRAE